MSKKLKNIFNLFDLSVEKLEEVTQKSKLDSIDYVSFDTLFNERGKFEYALFKYKMSGKVKVRMLRLFHIKSVSNQIRTQINNEEAFRNILNKFGKEHTSFVSLYSYKPGKNMIIAYGVLVDGNESELKKMEKETALYINSLEDKFRAAYNNVEVEPLTTKEEWLFEGFHYEHLSVMRGVPKPDPNVGAKVGSTPYGSAPRMGRQVSEILLKGMTANRQGKVAQGHPFLMYTVFDRLSYDEVERALHQIQDTLSKLWSSRQYAMSENESFSLPILFTLGMGEMLGQSHGTSVGHGDAHAVSDASGQSHSVGKSTGFSNGHSDTSTDATNKSDAKSNSHNQGGGGALGVNFGINDSFNWSQGDASGKTHTAGSSHSEAMGDTNSTTYGSSNSDGTSNTHSVSNTKSTSASETAGTSQSQNKSMGMSGGASSGSGSGVGRQQINHFFDFAIEMFMINELRFKHSLRDGMYDYRTFLLTKEEQGKVTAEELIKQSYMDNHSPFPIRVIEMEKEEEKSLKKYARMMAKPLAPEPKPVLPERWKHSTYITPMEASAFNLPQENLVGYLSSFDPVPPSVSFIGEMEDGAEIGYQINPALNLESPMPFNVVKEKLSHIGIFGATGVGKTVFTQKYVSSVHNRYNINFMLFDWTRNHRSLIGHLKDPRKFRFNSFDTNLFPLKINLIVPPRGVKPYLWNSVVSELMCHSMGLGDRSFRIITKVLRKTQLKGEERNYIPTMQHFANEIEAEYSRRMRDYEARGIKFMPSNEQQTFGSMIERLEEWLDNEHPVFKVMCEGPFMEIEDLVAGDFVHLIECMELPLEIRQFVINGIAAGVFYYCKSRDVKLKNPTYLMFEEAHTVLKEPQGKEPLNIAETIFETINREARNFNLFIGYICQSPEKLPPLIFDNLPLRVIFQLPDDEGKKKVISAGGKDPIRLDIDLVKWLSNQPMGTCLIRNSKFTRLQDAEFAAVKVSMLPTDELDDKMFRTLYQNSKMKQSVK